jgi:DNA-3-methyladenine glycosylase II
MDDVKKALTHLKKSDPVMANIIEKVGPYRVEFREPSFAMLVRSIVFQQLHGKAASTIYNRLKEACGGAITPESILALSVQKMRAVGLSKQKLSYIRDLAGHTARRDIVFEELRDMTDEDVIAHLTQVKGIGAWTAQMFLMFALRRVDVMPTADFGINSAIKKHYRKRKMPKPKDIEKLSKSWQPYRSVACWYLWRSLDGDIEI